MISFELGDRRQRVEARVGHRDVADVRLDGAERIVGGLRRRRLRQRVEERRLADVRQADDAAFETHGSRSFLDRGPLATAELVMRWVDRKGGKVNGERVFRPA